MKTVTDRRSGVEILKATTHSEWLMIERAFCGFLMTRNPSDGERPEIYRRRRLASLYGENAN